MRLGVQFVRLRPFANRPRRCQQHSSCSAERVDFSIFIPTSPRRVVDKVLKKVSEHAPGPLRVAYTVLPESEQAVPLSLCVRYPAAAGHLDLQAQA